MSRRVGVVLGCFLLMAGAGNLAWGGEFRNCPAGIEIGPLTIQPGLPPKRDTILRRAVERELAAQMPNCLVVNRAFPLAGGTASASDSDSEPAADPNQVPSAVSKDFQVQGYLNKTATGYHLGLRVTGANGNGVVAQTGRDFTDLRELVSEARAGIDTLSETLAQVFNCITLDPKEATLSVAQGWQQEFEASVTDLKGDGVPSGVVRFSLSDGTKGTPFPMTATLSNGSARTNFKGSKGEGKTRLIATVTAHTPDGREGMTTQDSAEITLPHLSVSNKGGGGKGGGKTPPPKNPPKESSDTTLIANAVWKGQFNVPGDEDCPPTSFTLDLNILARIPLHLDSKTGEINGNAEVSVPATVYTFSGTCNGNVIMKPFTAHVLAMGHESGGTAQITLNSSDEPSTEVEGNVHCMHQCASDPGQYASMVQADSALDADFSIPWHTGAVTRHDDTISAPIGYFNIHREYRLGEANEPPPPKDPCKNKAPLSEGALEKALGQSLGSVLEGNHEYVEAMVNNTYLNTLKNALEQVGFKEGNNVGSDFQSQQETFPATVNLPGGASSVQILVHVVSTGGYLSAEGEVDYQGDQTGLNNTRQPIRVHSQAELDKALDKLNKDIDNAKKRMDCLKNETIRKALEDKANSLPNDENRQDALDTINCLKHQLEDQSGGCG